MIGIEFQTPVVGRSRFTLATGNPLALAEREPGVGRLRVRFHGLRQNPHGLVRPAGG